LPKEDFQRFKNQINIKDISHRLRERRANELQKKLDLDAILDLTAYFWGKSR
jgi:hypothetical protein